MFPTTPATVNQPALQKSTKVRWLRAGLNLLALAVVPPLCCLCARSARPAMIDLCPYCAECLPRLAPGFVMVEGRALLAPFAYTHPVDYMVRALKFRGERVHARVFAQLLAGARAALPRPLPHVIVPVPLHPLRYLERGFNQAEELARGVARALQIPLQRGALVRERHTAEQSHLGALARRLNPGAAFAAPRRLEGQRVALVDDVLTTGSTAASAAAALEAAGAAAVEIWVAARAQPRSAYSVTMPANTSAPK